MTVFEYKVTFKHHFQNSWPVLIYLVIFSALPFYMIWKYGPEDIVVFIKLASVGFLIFFVPQLILHLNYYLLNKDDIVLYSPFEKKIVVKRRAKTDSFYFGDIRLMKRYKSFPAAENRMEWFPWDSYNYSIIHLKDGRQFVVTSLLVPNMDLPIELEKVKLKKVFYPYARRDRA